MRKTNLWIVTILFLCLFVTKCYPAKPIITVVKVEGVINPITERFILNVIEKSIQKNAMCVIIEMDTPGGLETSMHNIVKEILNAKIPIITFISPKGARAASAGVFIVVSSDIAVMAPSTHIGAAHPVSIGGPQDKTMIAKSTNDLMAFVKSIAEKKNRNPQWYQEAVKKSSSITEEEALKIGVIDLIAEDISDLLKKIDGRKIKKGDFEVTLHTSKTRIEEIKMNFRENFLHDIAEPNIAYILLMIGIYGLIYEFTSGGIGFGAIIGSICLILAFFGLSNLPINLAGLLLIILSFILFLLEIKIVSHGILTIGGGIALILGSFMLIDSQFAPLTISPQLILVVSGLTILFFLVAIVLGLKAQRRKITTGIEGMLDETGIAKTNIVPEEEGLVFLQGEIWSAITEEALIEPGQKIKVIDRDGMKLKVKLA